MGWASRSPFEIGKRQLPILFDEGAENRLFDLSWFFVRLLPADRKFPCVDKLPYVAPTPMGTRPAKSELHKRMHPSLKSGSVGCATSFADIQDLRLGKPAIFEDRNRN